MALMRLIINGCYLDMKQEIREYQYAHAAVMVRAVEFFWYCTTPDVRTKISDSGL